MIRPQRAISAFRRSLAVAVVVTAMGCDAEVTVPPEPGPGVRYPVAFAGTGRYLAVAGANFDRAYRAGALALVDTTTDRWVRGPRVDVPSYAAGMAVGPTATSVTDAQIWVTARDDDTITRVDLELNDALEPELRCGQAAGSSGPCDTGHLLHDENGEPTIGDDPIAVWVSDSAAPLRTLHTASTTDGRVSVYALVDASGAVLTTPRYLDHVLLGAGVDDLITSPLTGRSYISDQFANRLVTYDLAAVTDSDPPSWEMVLGASIVLPAAGAGTYGRGMALSGDAGRLYVAWRNPNALLIVDIAPTLSGTPHDVLVDVIGLGGQPARVAVAPSRVDGGELVYVSCYGSDDIWVVDPELRAVAGVIDLGQAPYGLAVVDDPVVGLKLYAGLFNRHKVAVIPLEPGADGRHTVTAEVE